MNDSQLVRLSRSARDITRFLRVSYRIYGNDPHWVAPLLFDLKKVFTAENPLFRHAEMQLWVVNRNGEDVGRIAGIIDQHYIGRKGAQHAAAFFGFFESVEDLAVSKRLFEAVVEWARRQGMGLLIGPMNPTSNDECGLLVEGFDSAPFFMMTYNPPYYSRFLEAQQFQPAKELLAYHIDLAVLPMQRFARLADRVRQKNRAIRFRPILRKTLSEDLPKIKEIYNEAWQENWGFVPMTEPEIDFLAARLKPLLEPGLIWIAETEREPVGFLLALPDYNVPLKAMQGKLFTPKALQFILHLLGARGIPRARVLTLGVKKKFRQKGIESALLIEGLKTAFKLGIREAEASWILEDNRMMRRLLESIGGRVYKAYRIYQRRL